MNIKMYSLIIPPKFLGELVALREKFKISIRAMILQAIRKYIDEMKKQVAADDSKGIYMCLL